MPVGSLLPFPLGEGVAASGWKPYRPPLTPVRGWRVGPLEVSMDAAVGDAAGLDADLRVDQSNTMDLAVCDGGCFDATVAVGSIVDSRNDMLPAVADGAGLAANIVVNQSVVMDPAVSAGVALAPTLTVLNPVRFGAAGSGDWNFANPGGFACSWSHVKPAADNFVVVAFAGQTTSNYAYHFRTATYGGTAMSSLGVADAGPDAGGSGCYIWAEWFYLAAPLPGTQTVTVTVSDAGNFAQGEGNSFSYENVGDIVYPIAAKGQVTPLSHIVSSVVNRVLVQAASSFQNPSLTSHSSRYSSSNLDVQDAAGATSVTLTGNTVPGYTLASAVLQLLPL